MEWLRKKKRETISHFELRIQKQDGIQTRFSNTSVSNQVRTCCILPSTAPTEGLVVAQLFQRSWWSCEIGSRNCSSFRQICYSMGCFSNLSATPQQQLEICAVLQQNRVTARTGMCQPRNMIVALWDTTVPNAGVKTVIVATFKHEPAKGKTQKLQTLKTYKIRIFFLPTFPSGSAFFGNLKGPSTGNVLHPRRTV